MSESSFRPVSEGVWDKAFDKARIYLETYRTPLAIAAVAVVCAALFSRIMAYPLRHDEHFYLAAAFYADRADLYREINYTHLPNFPLMMRAVLDLFGTERVLLTGRLVVVLFWGVSLYALYAIARFMGGSRAFGLMLAVLLALNPLLLGPAGMIVTNNFAPVPFALLGLLFLLKGASEVPGKAMQCFLAGVFFSVAIGMKANYALLIPAVGLCALLAPRQLPLAQRFVRVTLPLAVGALLAGIPTLFYLIREPQSFLAHVVRFHGDAHVAFWTAQSELEGPVALGLRGKMILAQGAWLAGGTLLIFLLVAYLAIVRLRRGGDAAEPGQPAPLWPIVLTSGLVGLALAISFVPTPGFPQYYAPPIAFALVLCAVLYGPLGSGAKAAAQPVLAAVMILSAIAAAPMLLPDLRTIARPSAWTGNSVHRAAAGIAARIGPDRMDGPVLTLAPIHAIEAGLSPYDGLLIGPFIYRGVEYVNETDRQYFSAVQTPSGLTGLLEAAPPSAVLVGTEEYLDVPLEEWAKANGFTAYPVDLGDKRKGAGTVYVSP
ncbi:hypothetical protein [Qipengyuania zhejiangensis]|uniref:hypothetical protein n=1 Tax=Qipengyuania zhejiangensis TaxID=3077782 RepID=UPI003EBBD641